MREGSSLTWDAWQEDEHRATPEAAHAATAAAAAAAAALGARGERALLLGRVVVDLGEQLRDQV